MPQNALRNKVIFYIATLFLMVAVSLFSNPNAFHAGLYDTYTYNGYWINYSFAYDYGVVHVGNISYSQRINFFCYTIIRNKSENGDIVYSWSTQLSKYGFVIDNVLYKGIIQKTAPSSCCYSYC